MKIIFKYPLMQVPEEQISLPVGAEILTVQTQGEQPCIWAMIDLNEIRYKNVTIETFGTGHKMDDAERRYIGTYQINNGDYVFHVFERLDI